MNRDLNRVSVWYDLCGMKLKACKTKTMIVSRSRTVLLQLTPLTLGGTILLINGVNSIEIRLFQVHLIYRSYGTLK